MLKVFQFISFFIICFVAIPVQAQYHTSILSDLQQENRNQGKVYIHQDKAIVNQFIKHNYERSKMKEIEGYSILIFFETGPEARKNAEKVRSRFISKYETISCTKLYQPPYWRVYVGEFRTKSEAYKFLNVLKRYFPYAYVRPSKIDNPPIILNNRNNDR